MRERTRGEAADEVHDRLEILHRGHRIVDSSVRVDEVRAHQRGALAELGLARSRSSSTIQVMVQS